MPKIGLVILIIAQHKQYRSILRFFPIHLLQKITVSLIAIAHKSAESQLIVRIFVLPACRLFIVIYDLFDRETFSFELTSKPNIVVIFYMTIVLNIELG